MIPIFGLKFTRFYHTQMSDKFLFCQFIIIQISQQTEDILSPARAKLFHQPRVSVISDQPGPNSFKGNFDPTNTIGMRDSVFLHHIFNYTIFSLRCLNH